MPPGIDPRSGCGCGGGAAQQPGWPAWVAGRPLCPKSPGLRPGLVWVGAAPIFNGSMGIFLPPLPLAGVALVFGLNEVHHTYLDALAGGKRKTAAQAQWMLHNLEQRALGGELSNLVNANDGAFSHGVQANAAANGAPRHRS